MVQIDGALRSYGRFLAKYLHRNLSKENDILNAFGGIPEAFFPCLSPFRWGIPIFLAMRALTWYSKDQFHLHRRADFPTWSWTGWKDDTRS
ncbi:hypothetical protein AOQ84DRAFT_412436 [Glonium stellatum]|uniref:Uncharacterized protein n=1 Tax=Glonium stellatum TaxID=574774 RepID=A0A8E2JQH9_9PEZI|nr:hypothetical protein AOQ84DRAFT_412436 [Glonium stellatum]